ncbi:MAG: enoyl-CoA hydratase/isomerase family protein, partial [Chloroflexi bacterium]|nr:enoyl-CoA hydratase/isomerase family protein [Chloroflexota bacterium]
MITEKPPETVAAAPPARGPSVTFVPADATGVARIVIDRADDPVNAVDGALILDLAAAVAAARAARPKGLVVMSGKPDQFMAGADFRQITTASASDLERASREMQRVMDEIASLPFPTVAAINGPAIGGGLELALACDRRIMADAPHVRVGSTEVRLGILPAAGGTQRLPRLIGLPRALDFILSGRLLGARRAVRTGVVDEIVHPAVLLRAASEDALTAKKAAPAGGATAAERAATHFAPARAFALSQARKRVLAETKGLYPAPLRALDAVAVGLAKGMP